METFIFDQLDLSTIVFKRIGHPAIMVRLELFSSLPQDEAIAEKDQLLMTLKHVLRQEGWV